MTIPENLKSRLLQWKNTEDSERDYSDGLRLLVDVSRNRSYLFSIRNPDQKKDFIDYQLTKYIKLVVSDIQIEEVKEMTQKVEKIIKENLSLTLEKDDAGHRGKRDDHDSLPDEIKALYVENLDLLRQMREIHVKLEFLTEEELQNRKDGYCYQADRHPLLAQIINLDKQLHENWQKYDSYTVPISFEQ